MPYWARTTRLTHDAAASHEPRTLDFLDHLSGHACCGSRFVRSLAVMIRLRHVIIPLLVCAIAVVAMTAWSRYRFYQQTGSMLPVRIVESLQSHERHSGHSRSPGTLSVNPALQAPETYSGAG